MTTGERIRSIRMSKNLTQKELGALANIAEPTIRRYELGKLSPKLKTVEKIAVALGVHWLELLGDDDVSVSVLKESLGDERAERAIEKGKLASHEYMESIGLDPFSRIITALSHLNKTGQYKAVEYANELTRIPKYQKEKTPPAPPKEPPEGE